MSKESEILKIADRLWNHVLCLPVNYANLQSENKIIRDGLAELDALFEPIEQCDRKSKVEEFVKWAESRGIEHRGVDVDASETYGLGLVASAKLEAGDIAVKVPVDAIMSVDKARKAEMLRKVCENDEIVSKMDNVCLSLWLACEKLKGAESDWSSYISILPTSFDTPLYFNDEQLASLHPSPLFDEALHFYRNIARQYVYFLLKIALTNHRTDFNNPLKKKGESPLFINTPLTVTNFSYDLYKWCVSCVSTRVNVIPSADKRKPKMLTCMIPFMDMANHLLDIDSKEEAVYFDAEGQFAGIVAQKAFKAGDSLYIHYGKRANWQFFLHNGFVPEQPNPYDTYKLKMGFRKTDSLLQARMARLRMICGDSCTPNSPNVFLFTVTSDPPHVNHPLLEFARVFVTANPGNLEESPEEELKALRFLADRFGLLVRQYANLPVEAPKNDRIGEYVWRLKSGEKVLLQNVAAYLENRLSGDCLSI